LSGGYGIGCIRRKDAIKKSNENKFYRYIHLLGF
jgi:hypothetical protein